MGQPVLILSLKTTKTVMSFAESFMANDIPVKYQYTKLIILTYKK